MEYICSVCNEIIKTKNKVRFNPLLRCRNCANKDKERRKKISNSHKNKSAIEIEKIVTKRKNTCIEKYGVESTTQLNKTKEKMKNTCIEKYGVDNIFKSSEFKSKNKKHFLEKYGVDNPAKSVEIKKKISNSLKNSKFDRTKFMKNRMKKMLDDGIELYGAVNKEKSEETSLLKYGAKSFFASSFNKFTKNVLLQEYNWTEEEYDDLINSKKQTLENFIKKYNEIEGPKKYNIYLDSIKNTKENFIKRHGEETGIKKWNDYVKSKLGNYGKASKESLKLFIPLYKNLRKMGICKSNILFGITGNKEFFLKNKNGNFYLYDFTIKNLKIIIEYNGEIWHARQSTDQNYIDNFKIPFSNKTYYEQLEYENDKIETAAKNGYETITIWSSDNIEEKISTITKYIQGKLHVT